MPRVNTSKRTQVWRTYGAEETTSAEPRPKSCEAQSLPASSVHASGADIRVRLDITNRKRRAIRKQIDARTRALAELDAHAAELERMLRAAASHHGTTET